MTKPTQASEKRYEGILRAQTITETNPGTILKDFNAVLDLIGPDGLETNGKYHFLPMRRLPELNARLSKPMAMTLQRPAQKSYPSIHGLYLLLRASGLAFVQRRGNKSYLQLDPLGLASWHGLNPTERYFALLESWLLRGNPQLLGEGGFLGDGHIGKWPMFLQELPDHGLQVAGNRDAEWLLHYTPSLCILALLELFGIVTIQHATSELGKGWRINRIEHTDFGDAITYWLLQEEFFESVLFSQFEEDDVTDALYAKLALFFPELQHPLLLSKPEKLSGIYLFKVSLGPVWARIAIPSNRSLDELSTAILKAYKFDSEHLYSFTYTDRFGIAENVNDPHTEEPPSADEVTIVDLGLTPGAVMTYRYDFGAGWKFEVLLERVDPPTKTIRKAKLLEFHGQPPAQYDDEDDEDY
jgi:hypothetical protein